MVNDQNAPRPSSSSGCLRALLWILGVFVFGIIILALLIWQSVSWLKNAPERTAATYPPLQLSGGEKEDVDRVMQGIQQAKNKDSLLEEYITPAVFNGLMEKLLEHERAKGKAEVPLTVRGALAENNQLRIQMTVPTKQESTELFINADAVFRVEVVDGEIKDIGVSKLILRGRETPLLARWVVNMGVEGVKQSTKQDKGEVHRLKGIKLLKRDGDRLHFILDGKAIREQDEKDEQERLARRAQAAHPNATPNAPAKTPAENPQPDAPPSSDTPAPKAK